MDKEEFKFFRKKLNKTQKEMGQLLGMSIKAIHSYEQGWRSIPAAVERQVYFLLSRLKSCQGDRRACWTIKRCPRERKTSCPAWEFNAGKLCWFINGTICKGEVQRDWREKIKMCRSCSAFISLDGMPGQSAGSTEDQC